MIKLVFGLAVIESRTANLGKVKKIDPEHATKARGINSVTYETEWLSDDEADSEELQELLRDGVQLL